MHHVSIVQPYTVPKEILWRKSQSWCSNNKTPVRWSELKKKEGERSEQAVKREKGGPMICMHMHIVKICAWSNVDNTRYRWRSSGLSFTFSVSDAAHLNAEFPRVYPSRWTDQPNTRPFRIYGICCGIAG